MELVFVILSAFVITTTGKPVDVNLSNVEPIKQSSELLQLSSPMLSNEDLASDSANSTVAPTSLEPDNTSVISESNINVENNSSAITGSNLNNSNISSNCSLNREDCNENASNVSNAEHSTNPSSEMLLIEEQDPVESDFSASQISDDSEGDEFDSPISYKSFTSVTHTQEASVLSADGSTTNKEQSSETIITRFDSHSNNSASQDEEDENDRVMSDFNTSKITDIPTAEFIDLVNSSNPYPPPINSSESDVLSTTEAITAMPIVNKNITDLTTITTTTEIANAEVTFTSVPIQEDDDMVTTNSGDLYGSKDENLVDTAGLSDPHLAVEDNENQDVIVDTTDNSELAETEIEDERVENNDYDYNNNNSPTDEVVTESIMPNFTKSDSDEKKNISISLEESLTTKSSVKGNVENISNKNEYVSDDQRFAFFPNPVNSKVPGIPFWPNTNSNSNKLQNKFSNMQQNLLGQMPCANANQLQNKPFQAQVSANGIFASSSSMNAQPPVAVDPSTHPISGQNQIVKPVNTPICEQSSSSGSSVNGKPPFTLPTGNFTITYQGVSTSCTGNKCQTLTTSKNPVTGEITQTVHQSVNPNSAYQGISTSCVGNKCQTVTTSKNPITGGVFQSIYPSNKVIGMGLKDISNVSKNEQKMSLIKPGVNFHFFKTFMNGISEIVPVVSFTFANPEIQAYTRTKYVLQSFSVDKQFTKEHANYYLKNNYGFPGFSFYNPAASTNKNNGFSTPVTGGLQGQFSPYGYIRPAFYVSPWAYV